MMKKAIYPIILIAMLQVSGCNKNDKQFDASGIFETTEVIISAEGNGKLLSMSFNEGDEVSADKLLAQIDTVQLF